MANRDSNYTATGHDEETPPAAAGFKTEARPGGIIEGVLVFGSQCGVHGIGETDAASETIGVFGESEFGIGVKGHGHQGGDGVDGFSERGRGVFGSSHFGNGVSGRSTENDGVEGSSSGETKSGVFGVHTKPTVLGFGVSGNSESRDGAGVNGFSTQGVGVTGFSERNNAVVGTSSGETKSGVFGVHTGESMLPGFGVSGRTDFAQGVAVDGVSKKGGIGVRGSSDTGTGGVFSSETSAQINLVPNPKLIKLPRDGKAGDLLVINGPIDPEDPGLIGAILHVCLRSSDPQDPAMWGKVVFNIASD